MKVLRIVVGLMVLLILLLVGPLFIFAWHRTTREPMRDPVYGGRKGDGDIDWRSA